MTDDEGTAAVVQAPECDRECVEHFEGTDEHGVFFRSWCTWTVPTLLLLYWQLLTKESI